MSGYRQSSFDPDAVAELGSPLRPYNWVQWTGVVLASVGVAMFFVHFAGRLGWITPLFDRSYPGTFLCLVGTLLICSRRASAPDIDPELSAARYRWMVLVTLTCALVLGAAVLIEFSGA